jgi:hypothetical protein
VVKNLLKDIQNILMVIFVVKDVLEAILQKNKRKEINEKVSNTLKEYYNSHELPKGFAGYHYCGKNIHEKFEWVCPQCGKILHLTYRQTQLRKFCSGTCRNNYNNKFINGHRSKAEILLYKRLLQKYPTWNIIQNDRTILDGLELDIWIPTINFAIEWNGIYHYKHIKGNLLEQVQQKDKLKVEKCFEKEIDLYVVKDLTSSKKDIDKHIDNVIQYINKKYIGV